MGAENAGSATGPGLIIDPGLIIELSTDIPQELQPPDIPKSPPAIMPSIDMNSPPMPKSDPNSEQQSPHELMQGSHMPPHIPESYISSPKP